MGHLQHGDILLGIRAIATQARFPATLQWTPSHPERTKPPSQWTLNDWGIHQADLIAGGAEALTASPIRIYSCTSEELHAAVTPPGTWQWRLNGSPFHGSLKARAQTHQHRQYTQQRDMHRIYANAPTRWSKYCIPLMATLTQSKRRPPRYIGRCTKHLYDWMAHAANLAKGSLPQHREQQSRCHFCSQPETQQHVNVMYTHPPLVEMRLTQRRRIDEFFLGYRYQHLPSNSRWVIPLLDYMEEHLWSDTEAGGDIWNGRWTRDLLSSLLGDAALRKEEPRAFKQTLQWLQKLTGVLQTAQRSLYRVRHLERQSQEVKLRRVATVASWKTRKTHVSQTLFAAWNLPYQRSLLPRRKQGQATPPTVLPPPSKHSLSQMVTVL